MFDFAFHFKPSNFNHRKGVSTIRYTYIGSSNITSAATGFNSTGQDCFIKKIIWGDPGDGEGIKLYNKATAYGHASSLASTDSSNIAFYFVQPTAAAGKPYITEITLSGEFNPGLQLDGGSVHTDSSKVTIIWDDK